MSDYISKSELLERFRKDNRYSRHGYVSENYVDCLIKEYPTLDDKEIIRKPFERPIDKLCDLQPFLTVDGQYVSLYEVVQILKEECGINE